MILLKLKAVAWRCSLKKTVSKNGAKFTRKHLRRRSLLKKQVKLQIFSKDKFLRKEIISYFESSFAAEKLIVQYD